MTSECKTERRHTFTQSVNNRRMCDHSELNMTFWEVSRLQLSERDSALR